MYSSLTARKVGEKAAVLKEVALSAGATVREDVLADAAIVTSFISFLLCGGGSG